MFSLFFMEVLHRSNIKAMVDFVSTTKNTKKINNKSNKRAKLTQNTPIIFVVNLMVMTPFLEAGYLTWRADTSNSVFGQFKGHNSGVPGGLAGYRIWSRYYAHQHIHQV